MPFIPPAGTIRAAAPGLALAPAQKNNASPPGSGRFPDQDAAAAILFCSTMSPTPPSSETPQPSLTPSRGALAAAAVAVVVAAMLLRGPVTCIGPMAESIVKVFSITYPQYGTLAALPIAAFGIFSFFAAALGARLGVKRAVLVSLLIVFAGAAARLTSDWNLFLAASLAVGAGIALLNVILPAAIKNWFGTHTASMMGLYTGVIGLSGAIGGLTSVPLVNLAGGIHGTLAAWAAAALAGALAWAILAPAGAGRGRAEGRGWGAAKGPPFVGLLKSRTATALIFVMGLQSLLVYTVGAWLAPFLSARGLSGEAAGFWFFVFLATGLPSSILTPAFMRLVKSEALAALILGALYLAGIGGWLLGGVWLLPASVAAGASQGAMLSAAMLLMARKSADSSEMLAISALSQGLGYIGAGFGPLVFGIVLEKTASWGLCFLLTALAVAAWSAAGVVASRSSRLL